MVAISGTTTGHVYTLTRTESRDVSEKLKARIEVKQYLLFDLVDCVVCSKVTSYLSVIESVLYLGWSCSPSLFYL